MDYGIFVRSLCAALAFSLVAIALGQASGGQAGGGGGFGGGFGGGGTVGPNDVTTATHILTPGERGEWEIDAKEGESFIISARSEVFDPVIEVVDESETVLAQNDDVAPGDQRAQVLYRFPTAGKYKVLVKSFQSKAGGKYQFTLRRFVSRAIEHGSSEILRSGLDSKPWFRFTAVKGEPLLVTIDGTVTPLAEFYGPDGEEIDAGEGYGVGQQQYIVPTVDGEYYIQTSIRYADTAPIRITINAAHKGSATVGTPTVSRQVSRGEFDVWSFTATAGQLIDLDLGIPGSPATLYIFGQDKTMRDVNTGFGFGGVDDRLTRIAVHRKNDTSLTLLVQESGVFNVGIVPDRAVSYSLKLSDSKATLTDAQSIRGSITRGAYAVYGFEGAPGQIVSVGASASSFDAYVELYSPSGRRVAIGDDTGSSLDPVLDTVLDESGRYVVVVSSFGGGGSGAFELRKSTKQPKRAMFGQAVKSQVEAEGNEIWSFDGKTGQNLVLNVRPEGFGVYVTVYGPDGRQIESAGSEADLNPLVGIRLPADGRYTIKVQSIAQAGRYALWLFDVGT